MESIVIQPASPQELAQALHQAAGERRSITLGGNFSKRGMAGPIAPSDVTISTTRLNRVLDYEPKDLTLSVQAGMPYRELDRLLAEHGQMLPLDPAFASEGTIGGVIAANLSGPRRRLYGTARDMVIGMSFATLEGKLVETGGMVVKNVAGLDMAKLMIGSFGTLAAIATVNVKVYPRPAETRTFVSRFTKLDQAIQARNAVLTSVLQPGALDLRKTISGYELVLQAGGSAKTLGRYNAELPGWEILDGAREGGLWRSITEAPGEFLRAHPNGAIVRIPSKLSEVAEWLQRLPAPAIARAGSGVVYGYFEEASASAGYGIIEFAPQAFRETHDLWPHPGDDFAMMGKLKRMFDPNSLLNRGRLYGRL